MKKLTLTLSTVLITLSSFAQLTIIELKDEMTDKVYYSTSVGLKCIGGAEGFRIDPNITVKNGKKIAKDLIIGMAGLGNCNENNTLIFLFDNGEKLTLKSWNKFNCKGTSYFSIGTKNIETLKASPISKIRLTNGSTYKSYTHEVEQKNYFIELFNLLD